MHIVQLIDTLDWGGAQKMLLTYARAVQGRDVELTVMSLGKYYQTTYADDLRTLGATVIELPARKFFDTSRVWRLARLLRREHVDLVHSHLRYANVEGSLAGWLAGVPVVASLRSAGIYHGRQNALRRYVETLALRYVAACVMANGHAVAQAHQQRLGRTHIHVVPNAIDMPAPPDPGLREAMRSDIVGEGDAPLLVSVGRLSPPKGFPNLLRAFAQVRSTHPKAVLGIVGDGKLRPNLEACIDQLGLRGCAHLLGPHDDVKPALAAADVYVSASHWEGLPVAVLEAMAIGLPVVATEVGELPYMLTDGAGVLVPPRQPDALAQAIQNVLDDGVLRKTLSRNARIRVQQQYSVDVWMDKLDRLYAPLLSRSRPAAQHALQ